MEKDDVDDVFKDFGHKVEGKMEPDHSVKKEHIKHEKKHSEVDLLKNKYKQAELSLKEKYMKEKESLEEKKRKEMLKEGIVPPKNLGNIERIAYIAVIVVLVAYSVIDLSFYHGGNDVNIEVNNAINAAAINELGSDNQIEQAETQAAEEEIVEEDAQEDTDDDEKEVVEEIELSGIIGFTIDKINTKIVDEENDFGQISSIKFTLDNGKDKILSPLIHVYAYDSKLDETWETISRGEYKYNIGIKPGGTHTGIIELSPKSFRNLDIKKDIRLTLNDTEYGYITSINEKVTIS